VCVFNWSTVGSVNVQSVMKGLKDLVTGCLSLLEDIQIICTLLLLSYFFDSILYYFINGCGFCMLLYNFVCFCIILYASV